MMIRVWMSKASAALLLTASALALSTASAQAADLGGDCCADLEERIAELEATTARKGNRKVSLTVSGWVNEALFGWDDGTERNVYIGTNDLEQTRVKFTGEAKITGNWSAGYTLEFGIDGGKSNKFDQDSPDGSSGSNGVTVRKSSWFLKSKEYGKVTVGLDGTATYHLLDDADIANTRNYSDAQAGPVGYNNFFLVNNGVRTGLRWTDLLQAPDNDTPGQNGRRNVVRYDSPEFAGFTGTASWGEDDQWGVSLTYKGKVGDFGLLAKAGYEQSTDEVSSRCNAIAGGGDSCEWYGAAASIMHAPTGLYVYGAWSQLKDDERTDNVATADDTDTMWFVQAGIEQKWMPLGKTTVFGEYRNDDNGSNISKAPLVGGGFIQSSEIDSYGAGIVQNIDAAAMDLYFIYRHTEGDLTGSNGIKTDVDDFDMVITGARIQF